MKRSFHRLSTWLTVILVFVVMMLSAFPVSAADDPEGFDTSWTVAEEGMVLLKNEKQTLPLSDGTRLAVFGIGAVECYDAGGGSSWLNAAYSTTPLDVMEGLADEGRLKITYVAKEEECVTAEAQEEMREAAATTDAALIFIRRYSEEGKDIKKGKGGYELSPEEEKMVDAVIAAGFKRITVILNVPSVMDTSWFVDNDAIGGAVCMYYGGETGPHALMSLLMGDVNFSGKTADTWANSINQYLSIDNYGNADRVVYGEDIYVGYRQFETFDPRHRLINYPFGYGLSYTTFSLSNVRISEVKEHIVTEVTVKNTGKRAGKEVVQVYFQAPNGKLNTPARELAAFAKTDLLDPGKSQTLTLTFPIADMSSYDDTGKTGHASCYVLEAGKYNIYVGNSVADADSGGIRYTHTEKITRVTETLSRQLWPINTFDRTVGSNVTETVQGFAYKTPTASGTNEQSSTEPISYAQLKKDPSLLDKFVSQMTLWDLNLAMSGSPTVKGGDTGSIGTVLKEYNNGTVVCADTADGGVGLRAQSTTTRWPSATLQASTWNVKLIEELGRVTGREMILNKIDVWLAPGMNIHRHPLCGRNFEYFSEDPLLTGKMAAAVVCGVQSTGRGCCPKHFAANNIEDSRNTNSSVVSERALREIYLKGFEICVREAQPWCIMTSYNLINGVESTERYDLLTNILRGEWGYEGLVMTDWYNNPDSVQACLAGTDVIMPKLQKTDFSACVQSHQLYRSDLEKCVKRVVQLVLKADGAVKWQQPVAVYNGGKPVDTDTKRTTTVTTAETSPTTAPDTELPTETAVPTEDPAETLPTTAPDTEQSVTTEPPVTTEEPADSSPIPWIVGGAAAVILIAAVIILLCKKKK